MRDADKTPFAGITAHLFEFADDRFCPFVVTKQAAFFTWHAFINLKSPRLGEFIEAYLLCDDVDLASAGVKIIDSLAAICAHTGQYMVDPFQGRKVVAMRRHTERAQQWD